MTKEYESNYEKVTEDWRNRFLAMDQEDLIERFQLEHDADWLYLRYLGQPLKISRRSGEILFADREELPGFNTAMTAYNMFYYAKEHPVAAGELVPFRQVKRVYPFERAYQKQILEPFTRTFSGHVKELQEACENWAVRDCRREMQGIGSRYIRILMLLCCSGIKMRSLRHREICCLMRTSRILSMRRMWCVSQRM